jgi:tetratricopeptide (TPR) repeat protein
LVLLGLFSFHAHSQTPTAPAPAPAPAPALVPATSSKPLTPDQQIVALIRDALTVEQKGQFDAAIAKINAALQIDPKCVPALNLRGSIYTQQKHWDLAEKDYQTVLQIDPKNSPAKFDLAEILFRQAKYADARPGFLAIENDDQLGDLAAYKVFLCDLFGGRDDLASKDLDAFNNVGGNASYYFANAAWDLYHHKKDDAIGWLSSAVHIYPPYKLNLYSSSLRDLGYFKDLQAPDSTSAPAPTAPATSAAPTPSPAVPAQ